MDLNTLSKEQQQYLVLGIIVAVALVGGIGYGVKFGFSAISAAKVELQDLVDKNAKAKNTLSKTDKIASDYTNAKAELEKIVARVPPLKNYFSWAAEIVYTQARVAGVEVDAIDELTDVAAVAERKQDDTKALELDAYSLRITAHGNYQQIIEFLALLEKSTPLVRLTGVDIGSGGNPEKHDVQVFLQWPFGLGSGE